MGFDSPRLHHTTQIHRNFDGITVDFLYNLLSKRLCNELAITLLNDTIRICEETMGEKVL